MGRKVPPPTRNHHCRDDWRDWANLRMLLDPQLFQIGPLRVSLSFSTPRWWHGAQRAWSGFACQGSTELSVEIEVDGSLQVCADEERNPMIRRSGHELQIFDRDLVLDAQLDQGRAKLRMADAPEPMLNGLRYLIAAKLEGKGLFLHASAVYGTRGAVAFFGQSGAGKSTLASKVASRCGRLADDTVLVTRETGGSWRAWGVPLTIGDAGSHPLLGISALRHGRGALRMPMARSEAMRELMNNVVIAGQDRRHAVSAFLALSQLTSEVEVGVLHFYPGPEVVDLVADWVGPVTSAGRAA